MVNANSRLLEKIFVIYRERNTQLTPSIVPSIKELEGSPNGVVTNFSTTFSRIFASSKPEPPMMPI